jgi:hypothetical protein
MPAAHHPTSTHPPQRRAKNGWRKSQTVADSHAMVTGPVKFLQHRQPVGAGGQFR